MQDKTRNSKGSGPPPATRQYLCGFGVSFRATESLWCIGSKLCWANCLSATELSAILFPEKGRRKFLQLLSAENADFEEVSLLTNIPKETFREGTGRCLTEDIVFLDALAYKYLRYCMPCLNRGFHSVLMQFPLFADCPVCGRRLVDRCPKCGGVIEYAWRTRPQDAFRCMCGVSLWQPQQLRQATDVALETQMKALCLASAARIATTLRTGLSGEALRTWASEMPSVPCTTRETKPVCCVWTNLEAADSHGYWCGESRTETIGATPMHRTEGTVYLETLEEIVRCIGADEETLLSWQVSKQSETPEDPRLVAQAWALVWWRLFWEKETRTTLSTETGYLKCECAVAETFLTYFARDTLPDAAAFAPSKRQLRLLILAQVLRATYAHAYRFFSKRTGTTMLLAELLATPMPVICVSSIAANDYKIIWVHQWALSFAKIFFNSKKPTTEVKPLP